MLAEVRARRAGQAAPSEPAGAWAVRGACNAQPSVFDDPKDTIEALAVCASCPVLNDCYEWALRNAVDGVAGGMTPEARIAWRKANKIAEPVVSADAFLPGEVASADRATSRMRCDAVLMSVAEWVRMLISSGFSAPARIPGAIGVSRIAPVHRGVPSLYSPFATSKSASAR